MRATVLVYLLVALPVHAQGAPGTWALLPTSPTSPARWQDVRFVDPETGWIIGREGAIHATTDGGAMWTLRATVARPGGGMPFLRSAVFTGPMHGFAGALHPDHLLYETTDGGYTWADVTARIAGPRPGGICGMWAVGESTLFAAGWYVDSAHFARSTDGGQTWTSRDLSAYAGSLVDVYFWDELRGIVVGGTGGTSPEGRAVVLMTEDGGETWAVRHTASVAGTQGWKISFPTPTTGYVSLDGSGGASALGAYVLKTTDGGLTWSELPLQLPSPSSLQGVGFVTESVGWTANHGSGTAVTLDGGQTWQAVTAPDGATNRILFFGDSLGYAAGRRVYRYRRAGVDVEAPPPTRGVALEPVAPNPTAGPVTLVYRLTASAAVRLAVFDGLGREVAVVEEGVRAPGRHVATWDAHASTGLAPGVYLVRLEAGGVAVGRPFVVR